MLLAMEPASTRKINLCGESGRALYEDRLVTVNLGHRRGRNETLKVEAWQLKQIIFIIPVQMKQGSTVSVDSDCFIEAGCLAVVSLEPDPVLLIPDVKGSAGWMMADLFRYEPRDALLGFPVAKKKLAQEGI